MPAMSQAAAYLDAFRGMPVGANLIQAQRDCFGAHTYERTDREGTFTMNGGRDMNKKLRLLFSEGPVI